MEIRSTDSTLAADEKRILDWFVENFGVDDTASLTEWVWGRERDAERYVRALWHIAGEVRSRGRAFLAPLLERARRPKELREAEAMLTAIMLPYVDRVRASALAHPGDSRAAEAGIRELRVRLREELRRMYPDRHRATIDGAIVAGSQIRGGQAVIDFGRIVEAMVRPDALATTAASSHGVTYDR